MSIPNNILSVKIGNDLFAFDGQDVEQILRIPKITSVPLTSNAIKGVSSISGRTVTVVDMATILDAGSIKQDSKNARVLTVKFQNHEYGILVDEVLEMDSVIEENFEISNKEDSKVSGLYKKDEKIHKIISVENSLKSLSIINYEPLKLDNFQNQNEGNENKNLRLDKSDETKRCIFLTLGSEKFAISLEIAREIIFIPEYITPISEAGNGVMGMITLRDELIVALDIKKIINVKSNDELNSKKENRLLILSFEGKSLALLVDSISEVKDVAIELTEALPERFADSKVEAIYKENENIVSIISSTFLKEKIQEFTIEDDKSVLNEEENSKKEAEDMTEIAAFSIKEEEFALDIQDVQEIIKYTDITPVPEAPKFVDGIINLRGVVIPIVSLPERLGFQKDITSKSKILICNIKNEKIGLLVDDVNEIMFLEDENVSEASDENSLFSEVITLDEGKRIILKLRISEVLDDKTIESIKMLEIEKN